MKQATGPNSPTVTHDALIFGGGLAGTILADKLVRIGKQVLLINEPSKSLCSRVAAGLVNPIGGKRLKRIWLAETLLPHAKTYYRSLADNCGQTFFHSRPLHRIFADAEEQDLWQRKRARDPSYQRFASPLPADSPWGTPSSGFAISEAGYLDTNLLLDTLHAKLARRDSLLSSLFHYDEIHASPSRVSFREYSAPIALFAEGHLATRNPYFNFAPYKPAKGVIAEIEQVGRSDPNNAPATITPKTPILLKGKFILPRHDGKILVGATYNWNDPTDTPDSAGIQELEQFLDSELGRDTWRFTQTKAGVRPATAGAYPIIGPHPEHPNLISFNGFGSKGSIQIPYFADALIERLYSEKPLPAEVLPARFLKGERAKPKRWLATEVAKQTTLQRLSPGHLAIDATAGNGHDTVWLAQTVGPSGHVFAFDIQEIAIATTRSRIEKEQLSAQVSLHHTGHENLLPKIPEKHHGKIAAIVFNLGYLPGSDQSLITRPQTTLAALDASLKLLAPEGILSITLYPAHPGGKDEVDAVLAWRQTLPPDQYKTHAETHPAGRADSPYPIFVVKR